MACERRRELSSFSLSVWSVNHVGLSSCLENVRMEGKGRGAILDVLLRSSMDGVALGPRRAAAGEAVSGL